MVEEKSADSILQKYIPVENEEPSQSASYSPAARRLFKSISTSRPRISYTEILTSTALGISNQKR